MKVAPPQMAFVSSRHHVNCQSRLTVSLGLGNSQHSEICSWSWARLDALGCVTHPTRPDDLERVPGLAGSPVVAFCNGEFLTHAHRFRALGCPLVWTNCMTFLFDHEKKAFADHGPADAFVFQSEFQRKQLEPQLAPLGYDKASGHLIRGAFDLGEWEFRPRNHGKHEPFVVGRVVRPDADKWSSNT